MPFMVIVAAIFILLNFAGAAHAYLDPGSGSMFLQLLLGGLAAVLVAIKMFWHRILTMFRLKNQKVDDSDTSQK